MFYFVAAIVYVIFSLGFLMGSLWGRWSVAENMAKDISLLEEELLTPFPARESNEDSPLHKEPASQKPFQQLHIILASPYQKEMMSPFETLSKMGHEVVLLQNGQQVLDTYNQKAIDLIVLSLEMPLVNGLQATSKIRDFETLMDKHTPIIGVTEQVDEALHQRCSTMGFDGVWQRPLPEEELYALVNGEHEQEQENTSAFDEYEQSQKTAEDELLTFNPKEALTHLEGDQKLLHQIAQAFLREIPKRLHTIKEAIATRNGGNLHEAAHSLKGAASCLAAGRVFCSAHRLTDLVEQRRVNEADKMLPGLEVEMDKLKKKLSSYLSAN